jgi:hypothetical protein
MASLDLGQHLGFCVPDIQLANAMNLALLGSPPTMVPRLEMETAVSNAIHKASAFAIQVDLPNFLSD